MPLSSVVVVVINGRRFLTQDARKYSECDHDDEHFSQSRHETMPNLFLVVRRKIVNWFEHVVTFVCVVTILNFA